MNPDEGSAQARPLGSIDRAASSLSIRKSVVLLPSFQSCSLRRGLQIAAYAAFVLLAACGGGGGGGGAPSATQANPPATPGPPEALEITAFAPPAGSPGSTITVNGTSMMSVTSAKVGGIDASFRATSDIALTLTVPATARTGRIELAAPGRTVLSETDFTVVTVPTIAAVSPTRLLPPGRVTLTGTGLDLVGEVQLNGLTLVIATRTPTSIAVDIPTGATTGRLTVVDTAGVARTLPQTISIAGPVTISAFSPSTIVTGQTLTVDGTNLDRAVSVEFANGATAPVASHGGTTRLTAVVPDAAASGVFRVLGDANDDASSASALQVIPAIRVNAALVYRVAASGDPVTISGSGLTEVSAVRVGSSAATIVSRSATQLVFAAPNLACGGITLDSTSQPSVPGGSLVVGAGCVAMVAGVEFAQVLSQAPSDARLRLVIGKETWVRAFVVSMQAGVPAPLVRLTGYNGAAILGTIDMAGPAQLPVVSSATVPNSIRYNEAQSFNVELPSAWVRSGLSVRVEVDPLQQLGPPVVVDATPALGSSTLIDVMLVPLVSGNYVPAMPTAAEVLDELTRRFPIPRANITVNTRAAYMLTSVPDGLDTQTDWTNALVELNQLRSMEAGGNTIRFYFGFVHRSGGTIAGIGYVPGRAALGWDAASQWSHTMSHEIGHNLSRPHAPCGNVANPDPNYPYAGGVLSATPLMDSVPAAIDIISPVNQTDIMGYCGGFWFSDYNYREIQRYMEGQPGLTSAQVAAQTASDANEDLLLVSGTIGVDGLVLGPVQALRGVRSAEAGQYRLRLLTRDGQVIEHAFEANLVDHAEPPERQFVLRVPNPGSLAGIEVMHGGVRIAPRAGRFAPQRVTGSDIDRLRSLDWQETGGMLGVQWDVAAASHLTVAYVAADGTRIVLGMNRAGGAAEFDVSTLPAGGRYEFALSDGLNTRVLSATR